MLPMHVLVSSIGFGVVVAAVLLVATVGFTFQYAISGVFNLAYGAIMGFAMLIAYLCNSAGLNIWWGVILASVAGAVLSFAVERGIVRPMLARGATVWVMMIVTFAVGLIIENSILATWGPGFNSYHLGGGSHSWGWLTFTSNQLWIIALAVVSAAIIWVVLHFSQLGRAMRGTASNAVLAESCGIRTERILTLTWLGSGLLCGAGGALLAIDAGSFMYSSWEDFFPLIIAAAIVGGIGSPQGAMTGALLIGVASSVASGFLSPAYEDVIALGILVIVILFRPTGLFAMR
jgi:branched-subunit amino acid ABC-type transport system permease component